MKERIDTLGTTRRGFFNRIMAAIGGLVGIGIAAPLIGYGILPALRKEETGWFKVEEAEAFELNKPKLVPVTPLSPKDWPEEPVKQAVYVVKKEDGQFVLFDIHCTHVGCPVHWNDKAQRFFSPCHGGVFDIEGKVLAGPPPRPLDRYEVKIESGTVYGGRLYHVDSNLRPTGH